MIELGFRTWDGEQRRFVVGEGRVTVGRTANNDLVIDDLALTAQHCEFITKGDRVLVRDLNSTSGTFLDGEMVEEAIVSPGQTLNLGTFRIEIGVVSQASGTAAGSQVAEAMPSRLKDGTFSCLQHAEDRAEFECPDCFRLSCSRCFEEKSGRECPVCGGQMSVIDWSGLERTKEDVLLDLVPEKIKRALDYWGRYEDWQRRRNP